jgi:hypothetical protein
MFELCRLLTDNNVSGEDDLDTHGLGLGLEIPGELELVLLNEGGTSVEAASLTHNTDKLFTKKILQKM